MQRQLNKCFKPGWRLFTWIFLVAYVLTLSACGIKKESVQSFRTLDEIKTNGTIKVGVYADNIVMQNFDKDVATNIAKELGVELKTVPLSVNERISALENGEVDLVVANLTVTDERKEKVDFCESYAYSTTMIMTPESAPLTSEEDVNRAKIGVVTNTSTVTTLKDCFPNATLRKYSSYDELYNALKTGSVNAVSTDATLLTWWMKENEGYMTSVILAGPAGYGAVAPAVAAGNAALKDAVNKIVTSMLEKEMFEEMSETEDGYVIGTYDRITRDSAALGMKPGEKRIDGTYRSDDGATVLTVNGDKWIHYFYHLLPAGQYTKNILETLKKALATE